MTTLVVAFSIFMGFLTAPLSGTFQIENFKDVEACEEFYHDLQSQLPEGIVVISQSCEVA